jgi:anti-sigma B factor antagonist
MDVASRRVADVTVLAPLGPIDHTRSEKLKAALAPHLGRATPTGERLVLDLGGVDYISSAGLRVLMLAAKQVRAQGGMLVIAALQPVVREIFEISRFTLVFDILPSVPAALERLGAAPSPSSPG